MADVHAALAAVLAEVPAVGKDASNQGQGFAYRSQDAQLNAIHPLLAKHRLVLAPECVAHTYEPAAKGWIATVLVRYHAIAADGTTCVLGPVPGVGHDTFDKAMPKAMTYAFKTFLGELFAIASEDDPDGESPEVGGRRSKQATKPAEPDTRPMSQGQLLAQAAARAGFVAKKDDDAEARKKVDEARRDVLQAVTGVRSSKEITKAQDVKKALEAFEAIAAKHLELAYEPDGTPTLQKVTS